MTVTTGLPLSTNLTKRQPSKIVEQRAVTPAGPDKPLGFSGLSKAQANSLKASVMFGITGDPTPVQNPAKLSYTHQRTIQDSLLGNIEVYRFSNGQELYAVKDDRIPLATVGILLKTGTANEKARENGVSHFLEHLVFKGTKTLKPGEADRQMENLGASINAHTWYDQTFYFAYNIPSQSVVPVFKLWAELVQNAEIPQAELDRERGAVVEEIKMYADDKVGSASEQLNYQINATSPYRRTVLGPAKIIETISREEILDYYRRFYAPENRAILAVGNFDTEALLETVATTLNKPFEVSTSRGNQRQLKPTGQTPETWLANDGIFTHTLLGFNGPVPSHTANDKALAALDVLSVILGGGDASRLNQDLLEDRQLVSSVGMSFQEFIGVSQLSLYATSKPEHTQTVQTALREHVKAVIDNGVTDAEVSRAKTALKLYYANQSETQSGKMRLLEDAVLQNRFDRDLGNRLKLVESLTASDIQEAAKTWLGGTGYQVTLAPKAIHPKGAQKPAKIQFAGSLSPHEESTTLSNGVELVTQQRPGSPLMSMTLLVKGGNRADTVVGDTDLLAQLIERGTDTLPAKALQALLESKGINLHVANRAEGMEIQLRGLAENKDTMLTLFKDLLANGPACTDADLTLVRDQLKQQHQLAVDADPHSVADNTLIETMYPLGHPYGVTDGRIVENMATVTGAGLRNKFKAMLRPETITLSVVGPHSTAEAVADAESLMGTLPNNTSLEGKVLRETKPPQLSSNRLVTKTISDTMQQSQVMMGWYAPGYTHKDRATMAVLTRILSGDTQSRFFQTFREKAEKALAYSVNARYQPAVEGGMVTFYIGTGHENLKKVIEMFNQEVALLKATPASDEELNRAKLQLQSDAYANSQRAIEESSYLARHRGFGVDSREDLMPKIRQVTAADVQALAQNVFGKPGILSVAAPAQVLQDNGFPVNAEGTFGFLEHSSNGALFTARPAD